jgi:hypothetical protein
MRRIVPAMLLVAFGGPLAAQTPEDKAAEVVTEMRQALGGDKLETLKTLSLEGPFQRDMGQRQVAGTTALTVQLPNRMHRSEDTELPGGASIERIVALNGDTAWDDTKQRGGLGSGMRIMMAGPGGAELNPAAIEEARLRRTRAEMMRHLLAFFGAAGQQPTYVAVAEAPEGKADVLEVKNEAGASVRIFVDQQTHLPLMLQYAEVRPRMMMQGRGPGARGGRGAGRGQAGSGGDAGERGQRPDPEEIRRRMAQMPPPAPSHVTLYLGDYKEVDGVMIPHRLTQAIEGKPIEEWTVEKVNVNPTLNADFFEKK